MRTINNLQELIEMGIARNKTEAIDLALEHIVTEETTKRMLKSSYAQTQLSTEFGGLLDAINSDRSIYSVGKT